MHALGSHEQNMKYVTSNDKVCVGMTQVSLKNVQLAL
jgi:hypothetical protein